MDIKYPKATPVTVRLPKKEEEERQVINSKNFKNCFAPISDQQRSLP